MVTLGEVLTGTPWTGVSVNANSEAECSDTIIKGVKTGLLLMRQPLQCPVPWLHWGAARHVDCPIVVGRVVGAVESAHPRLTRRTSGPELHVTLLDRDGRGIVLRV